MRHPELVQLMHTVLDGEATDEEARELERYLTGDPSARTQFDELQRLFDGLSRVPRGFPPEGLVAAVMANIPQNPTRPDPFDQLSLPSGVFEANLKKARGRGPGKPTRLWQAFQPWALRRGDNMSEQMSGRLSRKSKLWIGGGVAAAAVVLGVSSLISFPPTGADTAGTIAPAQRYQAPQSNVQDVQGVGGTAGSQIPNQPAGDAAANAAGLNTGDRGGLNTGDRGGLNTGDRGGLNTGDRGGLNTGDRGGLNTGDRGGLSAGDRGGLNSGDRGGLNSGDRATAQ